MNDNRAECAQGVRALATWAAAVRFEDIPRPVLERAVRVLADDLAAMIGARDEPEVEAFHARTLARAKVAEATIFRGGRPRTDRLSAVVANGVAADWLELDEGLSPRALSRRPVRGPSLLAECEARDVAVARHAARAGRRLRDRHAHRADMDAARGRHAIARSLLRGRAPRRPSRSRATPMPSCCIRRSPAPRR